MKKVFAIVAVVALSLPAVSMAQFGGLLGGSKSSSSAGPDLGTQQESLVRNYVAAGADVMTANDHLAEALGVQAQSVNATATADSLSAKGMADQDKAISEKASAVSEALKNGAKLKDAEAKAKYAKGLASFATGVKKYLGLRKDAESFASGVSSASPFQMGKLEAGLYVAKNLPTSLTNLTTVLKSAVEFGKSNGVAVPKNATDLL